MEEKGALKALFASDDLFRDTFIKWLVRELTAHIDSVRSLDVGVVPVIVTEDVDSETSSGRRRGSLDSGNMQGVPSAVPSGSSGPSSLGILPVSRPRAGTWSIPSGYRARQGSSPSVARLDLREKNRM
ncbi:unnamed protein product [Notodromas monacha]|uniref:Uncharacterized protein n=1 Tax=Notodromas monacha TaxID=399045 RepID=A0A7R9BMJ0_9CRUS|nr:unnamed protein product [Notodromas monacha]CAG0918255.1 unnamed protein product [Notodromas monacha]